MLDVPTPRFREDPEPVTDAAYDVLANLAGVHPDKVRELSAAYLLSRICHRHPKVFDPLDDEGVTLPR